MRKGPHPALRDVLTVPEAAVEKGVAESSVTRAIHAGKLKASPRAKVFLIHRADLAEWQPRRKQRQAPAEREAVAPDTNIAPEETAFRRDIVNGQGH